MLDIKKLEKNEVVEAYGKGYCDYYREVLQARNGDVGLIDKALDLNAQRKKNVAAADEAKNQQNIMGKEIAQLKKSGEDASEAIANMGKVAAQVKDLMKLADTLSADLDDLLAGLPNIVQADVPHGASEDDNRMEKSWGEPKQLGFEAKDHADLAEALGIADFERAAKVTGARFTFLKGAGAQLERALKNFMLDIQIKEHGYTEVSPPLMVNSTSMFGTSQFPKFKEEQFEISGTDYCLIGTAEIPLTNYYSKEILSDSDLPTNFTALTPCFRSEAGSYGKDTKGLFRQHQFYKVELVKFVHPDKSNEEHELLARHAETVLERLELPYKRMTLCTGDIGFGAAKCYDLEVWLAGQNRYREVSSCSNFEDFQARRANIRFREPGGKPQFIHTLNGSGLAVGRTWIAILENYQQEDGSILVPQALQPYMDGLKVIKKS